MNEVKECHWYHVSEDLPREKEVVLAYSEVHGTYFLVCFIAARGWINPRRESMYLITRWCNVKLFLPWEILNTIDKDAAANYGVDLDLFNQGTMT